MNQSAVVPRLDLVGGRPVATSLNVADVFGKQHQHVLRTIRALDVPDEFSRSNFGPHTYVDGRGNSQPMYHITRDGFTLLAMGFTGARAMQFKLAYIEAFNRMEAELHGGRGRRTDIHHHRGPVSGSGLDIRYTLDLTKIITNPKPGSLALLERLTGLAITDIPLEDSRSQKERSRDELLGLFDSFAAEQLVADPEGCVLFREVYQRFVIWYGNTAAGIFHLPSAKGLAMWLDSKGYSRRKPSGRATVYGCVLAECEVLP